MRIAQLLSFGVATASLAGLMALGWNVPVAGAATAGDSPVTVKWTGDTGLAASYQPERDPSSPHFADFKNLSVTVSQTRDLTDQAVRVDFSGLTGGTATLVDSDGAIWTDAMNFVQAMQCWGDPAAPDFRETCEWGGRNAPNNGLGNTVYGDNVLRVSARDAYPTVEDATDVPFRTYGGTEYTGRSVFLVDADGHTNVNQVVSPILDVFGPATTNEIQSRRANTDGSGSFDFEVQTADQAPQLGCGREGHLGCWLVLVPRGSHYGGSDEHCSYILDRDFLPYSYGRAQSIQAGSPLNPGCDYWDNRVVVPLQFNSVAVTCPTGSTEHVVIGSQLLTVAMSSWQPTFCPKIGAAVNFASNPDSVARLQLVDGRAGMAFTSFPLTPARLADETATAELSTTALSYAPVAIGGLAIAFFSEGPTGRSEDMTLSPRLVAKLLTQSYSFLVPRSDGSAQGRDIAHLAPANQSYRTLSDDPEFRELNAGWANFTSIPAVIEPGPASADALEQLWRWVIADDAARAWLAGAPDEWGMKINPYYLPKGNAGAKVPVISTSGADEGQFVLDDSGAPLQRAVGLGNPDGSPMKIGEVALDRILKVDETQAPLKLAGQRSRYDSLQYSPYVDNFTTAAVQAFRANPGAKTVWDPARLDSGGRPGDWVSVGPQIPGQRFVIAITDVASAQRYALSTAKLVLPNSDEVAAADTAGMTAALGALRGSESVVMTQIDPAAITDGYPLTTVVWAAVNLTSTTTAERTIFGGVIAEIAGEGQAVGTQLGELPAGYVPLPAGLKQQAAAAAVAIRNYQASTSTPTPTPPTDDGSTPFYPETPEVPSSPEQPGGEGPEVTPGVDPSETPRTEAPAIGPVARAGLPISLGVGVLGTLFAPMLFRGRWLP